MDGRHGDPFAVLGMHGGGDRPLVVRTFQPGATAVRVLRGEAIVADLDMTHPAGFFEGPILRRRERFPYGLRVTWDTGEVDLDDAYRFPPVLGEMDVYLLAEGTHHKLYERLGAHPRTMEGVAGTAFAVWAPERVAGQRRRRVQQLGRPPPPDAQARRGGLVGAVHPRRRARHALQVRAGGRPGPAPAA